MKKLLCVLLVLALPFCTFVPPVNAAEQGSLPEKCGHCNEPVTWTPLSADDIRDTTRLATGHYYVAMEEESYDSVVKTVEADQKVCLYLNGKTLAGTTRGLRILDGGTLNIMGEGKITGRGTTAGLNGACCIVEKGGTLNQYGGTLSYVTYLQRHAINGGVVYVSGTYNLYDGIVENGVTKKYHGGNVYVDATGEFNMYGGQIRGGTAEYAGGNMYVHATGIFRFMGGSITGGTAKVAGNCVYNRGTLILSGDAGCDGVFLNSNTASGGPALADMVMIDGDFSGDVTVELGSATAGTDIGNTDGGVISGNIRVLEAMLSGQIVDGNIVLVSSGYCDHCEKTVVWEPLNPEGSSINTGHYYAEGDIADLEQKYIYVDRTVCVNLNGKTVKALTRAFSVYPGGTLNIMGGGTLVGRGSTEKYPNGGTINITEDGTVNLYNGTLTYEASEDTAVKVQNGGVLNIGGSFNMYGGTLTGGVATNAGGTLFVEITGVFSMSGGTLEMGVVGTSDSCIYNRGTVILSGNATVTDLYQKPNVTAGGPALGDMLIVRGNYRGSLNYRVSGPAVGMDIGNFEEGNMDGAIVTVNKSTTYKPVAIGSEIVLTKGAAAMLHTKDGMVVECESLQASVDAYTENADRIVLLNDVIQPVTASRDIVLDLNGYNITAELTGSATVFCRDSRTDDYTVSDGVYGTVIPGSCTIVADTGYIAVTRDDAVSFHKLDMQLTGISLRQQEAGVYLTATFGGDEIVSECVKSFGVVLNAWEIPAAGNMDTTSLYSRLLPARWIAGSAMSATGTMLKGIMKQTNTQQVNGINAQMCIFGRTYIETGDGYLYGDVVSFTLQQILEETNGIWDSLNGTQKQKTVDMYTQYASVMEGWRVPNVQAAKVLYDTYAAIDKTATQADVSALDALYEGSNACHGELHDHAATGGTSDGKQSLEVWKTYMEQLNMDFAALVDHKQVLHMRLEDWNNAIFIGGSEAATTITDREGVKLHYNMTFARPEGLEAVLTAFPEFEFREWTEADRTGCGGQMHFNYPNFTADRFTELCEAIYENGGFLSIVHPKSDGYVTSENPVDAWFMDNTGVEVIYTYHTDRDGWQTQENYGLWTGMLAAGKKVFATAGNDEHNMPSVKALSTIYAPDNDSQYYVDQLRVGNFTAGPVGIRMSVGDTVMGGTTDFTGKRLVFSVGDFHESVCDPTHTYRVDLISSDGIVFSQEISCTETSCFAVDAADVDFYRVEVWDTTDNSRIGIGNPIWNIQ